MKAQRRCAIILCCLSTISLTGCDGDEPEDIRGWMQESAKELKGKVPPLPEIKAWPPISYEPGDVIQPFASEKLFAEEVKAAQQGKNGGPRAINLDAYPLARVPMETIRLLGTLAIGRQVLAVVTAGSDAPRRIGVGEYIGQNNGRVKAIYPTTDKSEAEVVIKETVQEKGIWIEREVRLTSSGQGEQK